MSVVKKIVLVLIASILLGCKNLKVVSYQKPMSNAELARYIRLIEHRRIVSFENYLYRFRFNRNFNRFHYSINDINFNNNNQNYRNNTNNNVQTGTTGNTLTTPNVQPPIPKVNIKTKH